MICKHLALEPGLDLSAAENIVIIGGGQAGAQAVASLRQWGFDGHIALVCEEPALPYQRPPLSKAYMKGDLTEDRLYFKPAEWYVDQAVSVHSGVTATSIDRGERRVSLSDGAALDYDALILTTGSRPRALPLPGASLDGVFDLRTLADVEALKPHMTAGQKLVIVGAGYIGLEAAAVARQLGLDVTVLEMADRVLARVTSPVISDFYSRLHSAHGAHIRTSAQLTELVGTGGRVSAARLASGEDVPCDLVLVGIGIVPNQDLAEDAGIACANGILVDEDARTNDPRIFAAGDCANRPLVHYGRTGRLESVHNAIEQGKLAAAAILGRARPPV
ncbi:MAG: FAD-dependent oxidoreductase, partial [Pseudomonadota bacterium]